MSRHGMSLSFASIACDTCGATRLMTQRCPVCGFRPRRHETQFDLERRRQVLHAFLTSDVQLTPVTEGLHDAIALMPTLIADVRRELSRVARGGRDAHGVIQAFARMDSQVAHWSRRHPRPVTNRARAFGRSLSLLRQGYGVFAGALGSDTILIAQDAQTDGQALIDAAVAEIEKLQEISAVEEMLSGSAAFSQVGEAARASAGGEEMLATLDERLREMCGGPTTEAQVGIGLNLLLLRHLTLVLFDLEETLEVADVADAQMTSLPSVCCAPAWQARHGVVTAQFSTAAFNLSFIDESNDLEAATAALQLVMHCRDGIIRHCLATMFADDADDYQRLHQSGAGALIKRAAGEWPSLMLDENLSQVVRHAAAHSDYDIVNDQFVTHRGGEAVRLDLDEFLDAVLGYFQTAVSLVMALTRATAAQGVELELSRHTSERDLFGVMSLMLGFVGLSEATVERAGSALRIEAVGDPDRMSTAGAAIAAVAPESLTRVEATLRSTSGAIHMWEAPLQAFREYAQRPPADSEVEDVLALARVSATISLDDENVWSGDTWGGVAMVVFNGTAELSCVERVRKFKEVRDLTAAAGLTGVAGGLTVILEGLRRGGSGDFALSTPFRGTQPSFRGTSD